MKKPIRRKRVVRLAAAVMASAAVTAFAQSAADTLPRQIFALTNQDRASQGLPALPWSDSLARAAEAHAQIMAQQPALSHDYPGEPPLMERAREAGVHFQTIAENIATGWSAEQINNAWMHSSPHRKNILDPTLNALGVAIVRRGRQLYAVEDFAETVHSLTAQQVEDRERALLRADHVDASSPAGPAEQACRMWRGIPPGGARAVIRFETSDLTQLPSAVVQEIRGRDFARAAVGACAPPGGKDFTTYRVAILFY